MGQTTGNYSQSPGFNNANHSVYILKVQEMLSVLPYTSYSDAVQTKDARGAPPKNGPIARPNLHYGFNVPTCLTTIIRFNFTGLILSQRRSEFPNVRSGFTLDPCCYTLLGLLMRGINRGLRNYRRKVLISE
jgi:hypothetical protein